MFLKNAKTLPVIQTWEPDKEFTKRLLQTYLPIKDLFLNPLICIDVTDGSPPYEYFDDVIKPFNPFISLYSNPTAQQYQRVCQAGMMALKSALNLEWDFILYMEGDIILSRHLPKVWEIIKTPENMGLLTFYTPGYEYETKFQKNYPIYQFPGQRFYGIQCVLFSREIVQDFVDNEHSLLSTFPGYNDIRWKEFLLSKNKDFWCTHMSYAQHIAPNKPHKAKSNPHTSSRFYD